jgi:DNA polymerase V
MYLAKVALDILSKHSPGFIWILDEDNYRALLWDHTPITDFWMIGNGMERRLSRLGVHTMRQIAETALADDNCLYREFGVDAEILIDHAFGVEPERMSDVKGYKTM